jgi:hypothetical protein
MTWSFQKKGTERMMKQIWRSPSPPRGIRYSMKNGQRNKTMDQHHLTFFPKVTNYITESFVVLIRHVLSIFFFKV